MIRKVIQLEEAQATELKRLAVRRGTSVAALVREAVMTLIERESAEWEEILRRAFAAAGKFRSGFSDISENHDKYLNEGPRARW